jgi:hypothetical protein
MKKIIIFFYFQLFIICATYSQCDYSVKETTYEGSQDLMRMITKDLVLPSKSGVDLQFNVCKIEDKYYLVGRIVRNLSQKFTISVKCPLVLSFENANEVLLFPAVKDSTQQFNIYKFEPTLWTRIGSVVYEVSREQLTFLSENIPTLIKLHYISEDIKSKYSDQYGDYWKLDMQTKMYYGRFMKVAKCALVQLN